MHLQQQDLAPPATILNLPCSVARVRARVKLGLLTMDLELGSQQAAQYHPSPATLAVRHVRARVRQIAIVAKQMHQLLTQVLARVTLITTIAIPAMH